MIINIKPFHVHFVGFHSQTNVFSVTAARNVLIGCRAANRQAWKYYSLHYTVCM